MAKSKPETIILKGDPLYKERQVKDVANTSIKPGNIVQLRSDDTVELQSTAGANCARAFVVENDLIGKEIGDTYGRNDRCHFAVFCPGQEVYARVKAQAAAIVIGDELMATATGSVEKHAGNNTVIGRALEAVDNSASNDETFIAMEVA